MDKLDARLGNVETQMAALPRTIAEMMSEMIGAFEKRIMAAIAGRV